MDIFGLDYGWCSPKTFKISVEIQIFDSRSIQMIVQETVSIRYPDSSPFIPCPVYNLLNYSFIHSLWICLIFCCHSEGLPETKSLFICRLRFPVRCYFRINTRLSNNWHCEQTHMVTQFSHNTPPDSSSVAVCSVLWHLAINKTYRKQLCLRWVP